MAALVKTDRNRVDEDGQRLVYQVINNKLVTVMVESETKDKFAGWSVNGRTLWALWLLRKEPSHNRYYKCTTTRG